VVVLADANLIMSRPPTRGTSAGAGSTSSAAGTKRKAGEVNLKDGGRRPAPTPVGAASTAVQAVDAEINDAAREFDEEEERIRQELADRRAARMRELESKKQEAEAEAKAKAEEEAAKARARAKAEEDTRRSTIKIIKKVDAYAAEIKGKGKDVGEA
jgi:hypothetical protein